MKWFLTSRFVSSYVAMMEENSLQGTQLIFGNAYSTQVKDDDMVSTITHILGILLPRYSYVGIHALAV